MAEKSPFNPRAALPAETAPQPKSPRLGRARIVRLAAWFGLLGFGAIAVVGMIGQARQEADIWSLANAEPAAARAALARDWSQSDSPAYLETIAELALQQPDPDEADAFLAARRATELDPSRAFAWAMLAYLEARHAGGEVNAVARDALVRSMDACPLCDQPLIRWRFNFVLAHWDQIPDPVRRRAFEQADVLRWMGDNAEFLAEMHVKARLAGIPFEEYRAAVDTPMRTWDIGPAPGPRDRGESPA